MCKSVHKMGVDVVLWLGYGVLRKEQRMTSWQPIGTAPRDKMILIYDDEYGVRTAFWQMNLYWDDGRLDDNFYSAADAEPTHWQSLPEPPKVDV